jgi:hypothetical protein
VKSNNHAGTRRRRVRPAERTPEQIAFARADAILARAVLRAEALVQAESGGVVAAPQRDLRPEQADPSARQRALFAAAIARAEFGRFYWSKKASRPPKPGKRPSHNSKSAA